MFDSKVPYSSVRLTAARALESAEAYRDSVAVLLARELDKRVDKIEKANPIVRLFYGWIGPFDRKKCEESIENHSFGEYGLLVLSYMDGYVRAEDIIKLAKASEDGYIFVAAEDVRFATWKEQQHG